MKIEELEFLKKLEELVEDWRIRIRRKLEELVENRKLELEETRIIR